MSRERRGGWRAVDRRRESRDGSVGMRIDVLGRAEPSRDERRRDDARRRAAQRDDDDDDMTLAVDAVDAFVRARGTPRADDCATTLAKPTGKTLELLAEARRLLELERRAGGALAVDAETPSRATSHGAGYVLSKEVDDVVVGLQTTRALERTMKPLGGLRVVEKALGERGATMKEDAKKFFDDWVTTHNDAVFDLYTDEMRSARKAHLLLGLPDAYGRGRLIGDYRRVALFGVDRLIAEKQIDKDAIATSDEEDLRARFEVSEQIRALERLKAMAKMYGFDIGAAARDCKEAVQWTYFAYLACVKEHDGAAISLGRVDAFFDVYIERDMKAGFIDESGAQELIDNFVLKLRLVRHLRPEAYDDIFAGDPIWATCCVGGMQMNGTDTLVTKTSWRFLQTLRNMGAAPEPNMTVLWSESLPKPFKEFAAAISIESSSIQFISDGLLREKFQSSDVGISCCVSGMQLGHTMQYFGARCNLPKLLLYALNGGRDEITGARVAPALFDDEVPEGVLQYDDVMKRFTAYTDWLAKLYVETMNCIHYSHDRFNYEALFFALMDTDCKRMMAFGIAGLSVVADSLSAIKHAKVKMIRDEKSGLSTRFEVDGDWPAFGNDDDEVDTIAASVVETFISSLRKTPAYRGSEHTLSILTITSNVMYGKHTGATPDLRKLGEPFAPGANPMHNRDKTGALNSLNSVAKIPYASCMDGISNTFSITAPSLGKTDGTRVSNLTALLDGYFSHGAQHLNVNCIDRSVLLDAMAHPDNYPTLTIRVSGYAVNFIKLSRAHQEEVIARTFHASL